VPSVEKRRPHYDLKKVKFLLCSEESREVTRISREGAVALGYMDEDEMLAIIDTLAHKDFYKSMTTQHDASLWQDVYRTSDEQENKIYIKLQLSHDKEKAIIIQFKRDSGED
jgi:motility quorum-sensing regulator/GCU-specific mRNA interferase toxin